MPSVTTVTRSDIERQKVIDGNRQDRQGALIARMVAVVEAQRAAATGELGAHYALRQSLIDLAAISELLAGDLRAPTA
jgi:hypothetical protein